MEPSLGNKREATELLGVEPVDILALEHMLQLSGLLDSLVGGLGHDTAPLDATDHATKLLGLPLDAGAALVQWSEGMCSSRDAWVAIEAACGPTGSAVVLSPILHGPGANAERSWLQRLLAALQGPLAHLRDGGLARVAMRRLIRLGPQNGWGRRHTDPKRIASELLEPVLTGLRERASNQQLREGHAPGTQDERQGLQRRVDIARKKLWQTFALCWFGQPELLGLELAASLGAAALDKRLRNPGSAHLCEAIRAAKADGAPDEVLIELMEGSHAMGPKEDEVTVDTQRLITVPEPVPSPAQLRRTAATCTLRGTGLESRSCGHCTLGQRCRSGARVVVTRSVGDWLTVLLEVLERVGRSHSDATAFRAYLEPMSPRQSRTPPLKRALASAQRSPPNTMKEPSPSSESRPVKRRSSNPSPLASPADEM